MSIRRYLRFAATICILALFTCRVSANENCYPLLTNSFMRTVTSLNGNWKYLVDPYGTGYYDYRLSASANGFFKDRKATNKTDLIEYNFDECREMYIPHDWNTADPELKYYEGLVWFRKKFDYHPQPTGRTFLYFGAVNYLARVYLNGEYLGSHKGGFTPFNFEVTSLMKEGENSLVVLVDNTRHQEEVPTVNTDWWNYGGITRDVMLVEEAETFIRDYSIQLTKSKADEISGWVLLDGKDLQSNVLLQIPELKINLELTPQKTGFASFSVKTKPVRWCPENPKLYEVILTTGGKKMVDQIAFRTIETQGSKILLNGKTVFLKGICIHDEAPFRQGRINNPEEARTLLGWAKEMNCNFVRLAHYPHNEYMIREAEKMGLMVWSEIPVYWTISFGNEETYQNAQIQMEEMITRDRNRGAIIIWSMANETPHSEERNVFLRRLATQARSMDSSRFISMAMEKNYKDELTPVVNDPLMDVVDVVSFNTYIGWYDGAPEKCSRMNWQINTTKPVIISEVGGGALQGMHGSKDERWTEEYQEELYRQNLAMFDRIGISGSTPWILMDFRSPKRMLPGIQDGFNRKGLVSNNGIKKKAFYVLKEWYGGK
ncbi:MAG: glycoside hydrolase family 2 TIM barrel-domain containing protein [Bacteroidales bacterium]